MIVLDASALVELLLDTPTGREIGARVADPALGLHVPHLADVEVAQALRRYTKDGDLDPGTAALLLEDLRALDLQRHAHEPLLDRVWISAKWGASSTGRRVKAYSITRRGEQQLASEEADWQRAAGIVTNFFKLAKEPR